VDGGTGGENNKRCVPLLYLSADSGSDAPSVGLSAWSGDSTYSNLCRTEHE
jgi:hypothetical protein